MDENFHFDLLPLLARVRCVKFALAQERSFHLALYKIDYIMLCSLFLPEWVEASDVIPNGIS